MNSRRFIRSLIAPAIRRTEFMEYLARAASLVCFDVGRLDDLAPLLNFVGDELAVIGGCHRHCVGAQIGKPCLYFWIGEARIDFLVELVDDFGGRISLRAAAQPGCRPPALPPN